MNKYLLEVSPTKKNHQGDIDTARVLRYPFWHEGKWVWLEHTPLEAAPNQLAITEAINAYCADLRGVLKRAYLHGKTYHLRQTSNGTKCWYEQPTSIDGNPPRPRSIVTTASLFAELDAAPGRGPYSPETLRIRQALVRSVLKACWQKWNYLNQELGSKIALEQKGPGRQHHLTPAELERLIQAARASEYGDHLADAIEAAALIGWRRANLLAMTWGQVIFPVYKDGVEIQMGIITCTGSEVKNGQDLAQPISNRLHRCLARRWNFRHGQHIFHRGDGKPFGDFRKTWATILNQAELDPGTRWHDLRHTWASHLLQAGATPRQLQELGGWKSTAMPHHYAHLRVEHLRAAVELTARPEDAP